MTCKVFSSAIHGQSAMAAWLSFLLAASGSVASPPPSRGHGEHREPPPADKPAIEDREPLPPGPMPRPPRFRGEPPGAPILWNRMSEEERSAMLQFIESRFPHLHEELGPLPPPNPDRFERRMRRLAPEMRRLMDALEMDPARGRLLIEERRLDMMSRRLAHMHRMAANAEKKARLRAEVRELMAEAFERRQERIAMEIRDLEARIAELKQRHEEARQRRDEVIERETERRLHAPFPPLKDDE